MSFYSNIIQHLDLAVKGKDSVALAQAARDAVQQTVDYLNAHTDSAVIRKIRQMEKLTPADMDEIERLCFHELGTKEEFDEENKDNEGRSVAGFLRSLTGLDPAAVNEKFGVFLQQGSLNAMQQRFVGEVVDYLRANGEITLRDLMVKTPFRDVSIGDLFADNLAMFKMLKTRIKDLEPAAV